MKLEGLVAAFAVSALVLCTGCEIVYPAIKGIASYAEEQKQRKSLRVISPGSVTNTYNFDSKIEN